jgi:flagellar biosynthesis protein FliR
MNILPAPYDNMFMLFFFVYVRVSTLVFVTPVLSNLLVSQSIRAGLAFWIAIILVAPAWGLHEVSAGYALPDVTRSYRGVIDFAIAIGSEVLIGLVLGFIANILLQTIGIAGEIIGQQAGFSAASVFDPISGQDIFLMAQINTLMGTMIFLVINGPMTAISAVADSFYFIGPGEGYSFATYADVTFREFLYDGGRHFALASIMYKMGIKIAAPMIASMLMISIAEAFIARTAPQLNILAVGFAIRISISLIILMSSMLFFAEALKAHLGLYTRYAHAFLANMTMP